MTLTQFLSEPKNNGPMQRVKACISLTSGHDSQTESWPGQVKKTKMWAGKMGGILRVGSHGMVFSSRYEKLDLDEAPPFTVPRTAENELPVNTMVCAGVKVTFSNKMTFCIQAAGIVWPTTTPVAVTDDRFGVRAMIELHGIQLLPSREMVEVSILRFYQEQFGRGELPGLISRMKCYRQDFKDHGEGHIRERVDLVATE
jgi:hypothetical protein